MVIKGTYETVPIDSVQPHPRNPRRGDVESIRASIRTNRFFGALLVQRSTKRILAGEHRWRAAKVEGIKSVPVIWADVDDAQALRILLADNRTNDLSGWNDDALGKLLQDMSGDGGLDGTGFGESDLEELLQVSAGSEFRDADGDSAPPAGSRLSDPKQLVKAVLYCEQVGILEEALDATGEMNRGEALLKVCRFYLASKERQLDGEP
jgi:hypothetical protein